MFRVASSNVPAQGERVDPVLPQPALLGVVRIAESTVRVVAVTVALLELREQVNDMSSIRCEPDGLGLAVADEPVGRFADRAAHAVREVAVDIPCVGPPDDGYPIYIGARRSLPAQPKRLDDRAVGRKWPQLDVEPVSTAAQSLADGVSEGLCHGDAFRQDGAALPVLRAGQGHRLVLALRTVEQHHCPDQLGCNVACQHSPRSLIVRRTRGGEEPGGLCGRRCTATASQFGEFTTHRAQ